MDNNFVSRLKMPDNNFYLLRANINNDYLENHVWSKCGPKYGFEAIDHSNKLLSYNTLHYTCGRVVEIFRKQKFNGFQVREPYHLFEIIIVSIPAAIYSSIVRGFWLLIIITKKRFSSFWSTRYQRILLSFVRDNLSETHSSFRIQI